MQCIKEDEDVCLIWFDQANNYHEKKRQGRIRERWVRPGRSKVWWNNFLNDVVVPSERRENFRVSKETFMSLCDELRQFLQKQPTAMRDALSVETQVAATPYYLADEGRFRKVANAFGIGKSSVSTKIIEVCMVITKYLGPKYINKLSLCCFGRKYSGTDPDPRVNRCPNWHGTDPIPCEQRSTKQNGRVPPLDQNSVNMATTVLIPIGRIKGVLNFNS